MKDKKTIVIIVLSILLVISIMFNLKNNESKSSNESNISDIYGIYQTTYYNTNRVSKTFTIKLLENNKCKYSDYATDSSAEEIDECTWVYDGSNNKIQLTYTYIENMSETKDIEILSNGILVDNKVLTKIK